MKRFIPFMLLMMFSNAALAEWVLYNSDDEYDVYVDPATKRKNGNMAKIWDLTDYKKNKMALAVLIYRVKHNRNSIATQKQEG